jgi:putative redox protein
MKLKTKWSNKLTFIAEADGHSLTMDTKPPLGADTGLTPKQLLLAAACGCTGMDVASLLRKYKQPFESLEIEAAATLSEGTRPAVFTAMELSFEIKGQVEPAKALEAVRLSQTQYCSVNAMLSKAFPITYTVRLNSEPIGSGEAHFSPGDKQ